MIEFIPLAPILVGHSQVDDTVQKVTLEKVNQYLLSNFLSSPANEIVKTTYHTDKDFLTNANLTELKSEILESGSIFLKNVGFKFDRELKITSWLNVFDKDIMEAEHAHYKSMISGCYYVDSEGTENSGCFYINDQIPSRDQNRAFYSLNRDCGLHAKPIPGTMIFFESWVRHGVYANRTDKKRISIAFNID